MLLLTCESEFGKYLFPKKVIDPNAHEQLLSDALTKEQVKYLDELESAELNFDALILPNGRLLGEFLKDNSNKGKVDIQYRKNELVALLLQSSRNLVDYNSLGPDSIAVKGDSSKPFQPNGLAYGLGLKEYKEPHNPIGPCYEEVYGLDAAGFVFQVAKGAGLNIDSSSIAFQSDPEKWNKKLQHNVANLGLYVSTYGALDLDDVQSGDIICWQNHIGIIARTSDSVYVLQSHGSVAYECINTEGVIDYACVELQQKKNKSQYRGPRAFSISPFSRYSSWLGRDYRILRLTVDMAGRWRIYIKCVKQNTHAMFMDIDIPKEETGTSALITQKISAEGKGYSYNGEPARTTFTGNYNKVTNTIKGQILTTTPVYPDQDRIDEFEAELLTDSTNFIPMTRVKDNGWCLYEIMLSRQ